MKKNGIQHIRTAPFHPFSKGLAERAVQTFKAGLKKIKGETLETRVSRFLFIGLRYSYRITPQTTTGLSPAEMMMSRRLRSTFDLLLLDLAAKARKKQLKQKEDHDNSADLRISLVGDPVYVRNYSYGHNGFLLWLIDLPVRCLMPS